MFDNIDDHDYYKPILVKSSFYENYKYECRGERQKTIEQYLDMIRPYLKLVSTNFL